MGALCDCPWPIILLDGEIGALAEPDDSCWLPVLLVVLDDPEDEKVLEPSEDDVLPAVRVGGYVIDVPVS